ncbi:MAG: serine--tRNA ligase [Bacteroidales bacterium]|jgi:seryl-tRNA synthetase|nr:serine--tRNA ligase [Bacteroidales bacterium]MBR3986682.1 serine--tRNA ligase [Bacteroidales bacterium]
MLQLQYIKEHTEEIIERLKIKNVENVEERIQEIIALDEKRRNLQQRSDSVKAEQNALAKEIGMLFKQGKREEAEAKKAQTTDLKAQEKELMEEQTAIEAELNAKLISLPNAPHITVPKGKSEADNVVVAEFGIKPQLPEDALPHWDLCAKYDIVDFELGNKITGAGFPVYKGKGARLQRALIDFFLDEAVKAGYVEIMPPLMVNEASGLGTGQLPDKEGQMYAVPLDGFYMIPTAEVPITNIYRNTIVSADRFPIKHVGYSECFRREAGSYGKDVRGLNRLHEFSKVEIVVVEHPDRSYDTLEEMKKHVGGLLDKLGLPYHILKLCGGDISFTSAMTFDFEVWSAAQKRWLEVSSVSNFETFQANRMKLRFKDSDGKMKLAHTLNGSALALPRIVAALLENNQTPDGILMPACLHPYLHFDKID